MEREVEGYMEKAEGAYEEAVSMLGDMSSWEVYENCQDLVAYKRHSEGGIDILKVEFFIPRCPKQVIDFMYTNLADIYIRLNPDFICEYEILGLIQTFKGLDMNLLMLKSLWSSPGKYCISGLNFRLMRKFSLLLTLRLNTKRKEVGMGLLGLM